MRAPLSDSVQRYTQSLDVDLRLLPDDIATSIAHAAVLHDAGILDDDVHAAVRRGLEQIRGEHDAGTFVVAPYDEDVHSAVERRLHELVGEPAWRLHAGRSRNDQVATDLRLFVKREVPELLRALQHMSDVLGELEQRHAASPMPGYTHLQRAQPVTLGKHLGAYLAMLQRDRGRLDDALRRADVLPLGSAALAGTTLAIDVSRAADQLGFAAVAGNSLDAVSDRDFVVEITFACALLMTHLSRLCEDVVLWCSAEFSFMRLDDAHATGSSIMPQKRNPDVTELARGRTARVTGDLMTLLGLVKGLPLTYNRDLQEDKRPLYDALDVSRETLLVLADVLAAARFDEARMRAAASDPALLATDVAELLVQRGVPFREAHRVVATMVRECEDGGRTLADAGVADWDRVAPGLGPEIVALFDVDAALRRRRR